METYKQPLLRLQSVSVDFGGLKAVDCVSLNLYAGEVTALIGRNGSGKTSLLNAISGFIKTTGHILLEGTDVNTILPWQRARLGIVRTFQTPRSFPRLDEEEEVALCRASSALQCSKTWFSSWMQSLTFLQLLRVNKPSQKLVHGNRLDFHRLRRLEFIRISNPKIALLDEPFSGIGPGQVQEVFIGIKNLVQARATVLLVDHQLDLALSIADQVVELSQGKCIFSGTVSEFRQRQLNR